MKKIWVNPDKCISCGACVSISPNEAIFFDEDGKAVVDPKKATDEDNLVIDVCPTEAISLKDYEKDK